ncbi:hypothetical protein F5887DRAFT_603407 [Amanita rubescens]|nr:hypothetical protein F5887DRAFT_288917 [Amanita rubescens]KAF8336048.1 hypothetical protein F5887DRAFT_603407 [Amanita rubescens]
MVIPTIRKKRRSTSSIPFPVRCIYVLSQLLEAPSGKHCLHLGTLETLQSTQSPGLSIRSHRHVDQDTFSHASAPDANKLAEDIQALFGGCLMWLDTSCAYIYPPILVASVTRPTCNAWKSRPLPGCSAKRRKENSEPLSRLPMLPPQMYRLQVQKNFVIRFTEGGVTDLLVTIHKGEIVQVVKREVKLFCIRRAAVVLILA